MEEELYEARRGLDDTYYDHSRDAQNNALSEESAAYEESMNNYLDTLRTTLDEAKLNMDLFLEAVKSSVMLNADAIKTKYDETGLAIDKALTDPWVKAANKVKEFQDQALPLMNAWTTEKGFFGTFKTKATSLLKSPWSAGKTAMNSFKTSVNTTMTNIVKTIKTNVASAKQELNSLYEQIKDTPTKVSTGSSDGSSSGGSGGSGSGSSSTSGNNYKTFNTADVKMLQRILKNVFKASISETGKYDNPTKSAVKSMQNTLKNAGANISSDGLYGAGTQAALQKYVNDNIRQSQQNPDARKSWFNGNAVSFFRNRSSYIPSKMYAQGTLGTKRDELAITDESWIGEEITLAAGRNGQLQYLKKGSAVMPADISANLVEWGKLNPNMIDMQSPTAGVSVMSNYINKPEIKLDIENFLKVERVDKNTLPELEKLMDKKIDTFARQLNYSLKRT